MVAVEGGGGRRRRGIETFRRNFGKKKKKKKGGLGEKRAELFPRAAGGQSVRVCLRAAVRVNARVCALDPPLELSPLNSRLFTDLNPEGCTEYNPSEPLPFFIPRRRHPGFSSW